MKLQSENPGWRVGAALCRWKDRGIKAKFRLDILSASFIFVNNLNETNLCLEEIFQGLSSGTNIVSCEPFGSSKLRSTDRIPQGSIMWLSSFLGNVSWKKDPVIYYLQVVDQSKVRSITNNNVQLQSWRWFYECAKSFN